MITLQVKLNHKNSICADSACILRVLIILCRTILVTDFTKLLFQSDNSILRLKDYLRKFFLIH